MVQGLATSLNMRTEKIYNVDNSELSTVQKPLKMLAITERKQVGFINSAERGLNISVVYCTKRLSAR